MLEVLFTLYLLLLHFREKNGVGSEMDWIEKRCCYHNICPTIKNILIAMVNSICSICLLTSLLAEISGIEPICKVISK